MLDVNLGNKTLTIGVLIALILSYGMVNFDSGTTARQNGSAMRTALQPADASIEALNDSATVAQDTSEVQATDTSKMSSRERRRLERS